jgi:hypothetical protein
MNKEEIITTVKKIRLGIYKEHKIPDLWDGKSGERASLVLKKQLLLS